MGDGRGTGRLSVIEKALAVVTAVLALATGVFAYKTAQLSQEKAQVQQSGASDVATLQARNKQSQDQNRQLQDQNVALRLQLGEAGGPTSDPQVSTAALPSGTVRHSGEVTIAPGPPIDLDAPATDAKWGIYSGTSGDLYYYPDGHIYLESNGFVAFGKKAPDYATCSAQTTYTGVDTSIDRGNALPRESLLH